MYNLPAYYEAELNYRRESVRRDWRPLRSRRAARAAARNQVSAAPQKRDADC